MLQATSRPKLISPSFETCRLNLGDSVLSQGQRHGSHRDGHWGHKMGVLLKLGVICIL
jgi:hypothetical protein